MEEVAARYDNPDGTLPEVEMKGLEVAVVEALEVLQRLGNLEFVVDALREVGETIRKTASSDSSPLVKVSGTSRARRLCPGLESHPTANEANGRLEFMATFEESFLSEVVWGNFVNCQIHQFGVGVTLNSTMDAYMGGPVPLDRLRFDHLLFRLDGRYTSEERTDTLAFDFRLVDDALEVRLPGANGDVIAQVSKGIGAVAIRTASSSFCCDFEQHFCDQLDGDSCDSAPTGTRLSW